MPISVAPASSSSSQQSTNGVSKDQVRPKKSRVVRRRARARELIDSDEEIEREITSESDTDDADSSLGSDSESESELVSEDGLRGQQYSVVTPSTTQSPPPADKDDTPHINGEPSSKPANGDGGIFVSASVDWSEMVADEHRNGPADLPVIDFADLGTHTVESPPPSRKQKLQKGGKKPAAPRSETSTEPGPSTGPPLSPQPPEEHPAAEEASEPEENASNQASRLPPGGPAQRRPAGQTARQAYQRRLESDPSYVPVVGEFWGHDDRLLDKELRSLSGWWRGRWQGRGRGRGGFSMRGRGRGGFQGGRPSGVEGEKEGEAVRDESQLPPVERPWTHDGFEEMKRREEQRRAAREEQQRQLQQQQQPAQRGFGPFRGRGGFVAGRGRGGFFRGSFAPSPARTRFPAAPFSDRPRFAMKPEPPFTKRHEAFLHFEDRSLKPQAGFGPGYRVKLPGEKRRGGTVIRGPPRPYVSPKNVAPRSLSTPGLDDDDKVIMVRLPKRAGKEKAAEVVETVTVKSTVTVVEQPSELSTEASTPAAVVVEESIAFVHAQAGSSKLPEQAAAAPPFTPSQPLQAFPEQVRSQQTAQSSKSTTPVPTANVSAQGPAEEASASAPTEPSIAGPRPAPPVLPPLQTNFSPVNPASPTFGSPYAYPQALPPGIAMAHNGMTYEVATGRPVYLQATPPPPMYNPRPVMHAHIVSPPMPPFVPGHTPHHSMSSPDFYSHSPSPSFNGFIDPVTGQPLFTLPRQSSRVEIRAPTEHADRKAGHAHRPSTLRSTVVGPDSAATEESSEQPKESDEAQRSGESEARVNGDGHPQAYQLEPGMMLYNPYQQPYYYPEQYGYPQYMDVSHMPQYEMYPVEAPPPQQAVYY